MTLANIGDADIEGRVRFLNRVAETLTGWTQEGAAGVPLDVVFKIINEETRLTVVNLGVRALKEGVIVGLADHTLLTAKDGKERPIDDNAAPMRERHNNFAGVVLVFRDVTRTRGTRCFGDILRHTFQADGRTTTGIENRIMHREATSSLVRDILRKWRFMTKNTIKSADLHVKSVRSPTKAKTHQRGKSTSQRGDAIEPSHEDQWKPSLYSGIHWNSWRNQSLSWK